jgi:site-specific recombinase XerC
MYQKSITFRKKSEGTKRDYKWHDQAVRDFPTRLKVPLGQLMVDKLSPPVFQKMVDAVAEETPSKANHMLRYARLAFSWAVNRGHCKTNPAKGVSEAEERGEYKMPTPQALTAVIEFARERGRQKAHSKGSQPPYLAPAIEITYGCRLRGIEVNTLTDAHNLTEGIQCDRTKGSKDNITA